VFLTRYYSSDQIKRNEKGGACSTYGEGERCIQGFIWGKLRERYNLEVPDIDERVALRWIFRKWDVRA